MRQNTEVPRPRRPELSDAELRALAYFAIGVSSEGSRGGFDVSNRLSFAGTVINGRLDPLGNSGYSIGTLQVDLGAHPQVAVELVEAYQAWARDHRVDWLLDDRQRAQTAADLGRDGHRIEAQAGRPIDGAVKQRLDAFLQSDAGIEFLHAHDVAHVEGLVDGVFPRLRETALFRNATADDQVRLAAIVGKLQNQGGSRYTPAVLRDMDNGTHRSVADVSDAVDRMRPRTSGRDDYLESGRDHALKGAEVFIALRNSNRGNPLHEAWQAVLADPLVTPTRLDQVAARPDLPAQYAATKTLFLQHGQAPAFVRALDEGGTYRWGRPQRDANGPATAGLFAAGDDFVLWNAAGRGHARIDGRWSEVMREDVTRRNHADRTTDLVLAQEGSQRRLLHVDPAAARQARQPRQDLPDETTPRHPPPVDAALPGRAAQRPAHPLHEQARDAVRRLDAGLGRPFDAASERLSASAACLAHEQGFQRIDHVLLSERNATLRAGEHMFVVQGGLDDPARRVAWMRTEAAMQAPATQPLERLAGHAPPASLTPAEEQVRESRQRVTGA